jgi:glycosyltransferase involved in cell wall biosynthesis
VKTRIFATQYCSGDFICEIDSDDRVSTDYLEQMFTVQKKFQCDIVSPEMFIVSQKKSLPFYKDRTLTGKVFTGEEIFDLVLQSKIHGLFLCRSEIYKRAYNLDNLAFSAFNSDEFCSALVFYFGKSLTISGGQYLYLLRKSSITQTNNAYRFENINTSLAFIDFCKDNNLSKFSLSITQMNAIAILVHFVIFYAKYHRNFSSQEKIKIKQLLKNTKNRLKHETPNKIYGFKNRLKYIAFKFLNFLF